MNYLEMQDGLESSKFSGQCLSSQAHIFGRMSKFYFHFWPIHFCWLKDLSPESAGVFKSPHWSVLLQRGSSFLIPILVVKSTPKQSSQQITDIVCGTHIVGSTCLSFSHLYGGFTTMALISKTKGLQSRHRTLKISFYMTSLITTIIKFP